MASDSGGASWVCGDWRPRLEGVSQQRCIRSRGHTGMHRCEYGTTWPAGVEVDEVLALSHALEHERAAHAETQQYLERMQRMAVHYQQRALAAEGRAARAEPDPEAMPEPEPIRGGGGAGGDAAGGGDGGDGEDARAHAAELAMATMGALARLGELLVMEDPGVGHQAQHQLLLLARTRMDRLERALAPSATTPPTRGA